MSDITGPGPHPPLVEPQRGSDPPITSRGVSWKFLTALVGGACTVLLIPVLVLLVWVGQLIQQVEQLRADVAPLAQTSHAHDVRIAVVRTDIDALRRADIAIERDLRDMKRRETAREERR